VKKEERKKERNVIRGAANLQIIVVEIFCVHKMLFTVDIVCQITRIAKIFAQIFVCIFFNANSA